VVRQKCIRAELIPLQSAAMAGIIAQLTRAARERSAKRTYGTNKCM
jgi:hypothetical protein